ncbi:MAG: DUF1343 domain-containing protein [Bacteroidota bacterium]
MRNYFLTIAFLMTYVNVNLFAQQSITERDSHEKLAKNIIVGAECTDQYFPKLMGKSIAIVANQTSLIGSTQVVDSLYSKHFSISKIFSLEHGFRGNQDAGSNISDYIDEKTKIPVISLYGTKKKPSKDDLSNVQVIIYDIQDVGVRFYTYISSLHYLMEACAENNIELMVLDRPNPNGFYVDGPVLEDDCHSFVGMHPVPIVYGMTCGEYANMINEEGWLSNGLKCKLNVVKVINYTHSDKYQLPVKPSPNLPNMSSVYLYPSLGLFEGTVISVGRGTNNPFQLIGIPHLKQYDTTFTPKSIAGALKPPFQDTLCYGYDLSDFGNTFIKNRRQLYLYWLIELFKTSINKKNFFNPYFDKLAGTKSLKKQIISGLSEEEIYKSWASGIEQFKKIRKKYLLYPDFE